jgi:hypothetical protein
MEDKKEEKDKEYALRLFIDGKRVKSDKLGRHEAEIFIQTAQHLIGYLKEEYIL